MNRRIIVKPRVESDLAAFFAFIARDKIGPAERLLKVAEQSFELLARMPGIGRKWRSSNPRLAGIRVYPMPSGFGNYLIFYRLIGDAIEILTIVHGARDLGPLLDSLVI